MASGVPRAKCIRVARYVRGKTSKTAFRPAQDHGRAASAVTIPLRSLLQRTGSAFSSTDETLATHVSNKAFGSGGAAADFACCAMRLANGLRSRRTLTTI